MVPPPADHGWTVNRLDNNLQIVTAPFRHSQAAVVAIYVAVGSRVESPEKLGISHYLEHMLFKGTESRPTPIDISSAIEGAGGTLNAFTSKELTCYWARVPFDRLSHAVEILADSLNASLLLNEEIERERAVIRQEIRRSEDDPGQTTSQILAGITYGEQPLAWNIAGNLTSVGAITRNDLITYMDRWYRPQNMVVSVAGNVNETDVLTFAQQNFKDLKPKPVPKIPESLEGMATQRVVIEYRDLEQCNLALGLRTFSREDPDKYTLTILNGLLGNGMSSRLFLEIRERRGLAYSVGSGTTFFKDTGHLGIGAGVTSKNVLETTEVILQELDRLKYETLQLEELKKATEHASGSFRLSLDTASAQCFRIGESLLMDGRILSIDEIIQNINSVTPDDIKRVAQRFVNLNNIAIAVVGPYKNAPRLEALIDD